MPFEVNTNTNTNSFRINFSIPIPIPIPGKLGFSIPIPIPIPAKTSIPQYQYQVLSVSDSYHLPCGVQSPFRITYAFTSNKDIGREAFITTKPLVNVILKDWDA